MFIMIDGIDGSGKSTVMNAWKEHLKSKGNGIFDLKAYTQSKGAYPAASELKAYDFILSCEPTYAGIGRVIRDDLISADSNYPPQAIADSYSLDRLILYTKIILPSLQAGVCVLQDRGVSTSLAYQPLMDKKITLQSLSKLPGNKLALKNAPNHLVLVLADPKIALKRLAKRSGKQDNAIFERGKFLAKAEKVFESGDYRNFFTRRGTKVHYLRGDQNIDIMNQQAIKLLNKLI